MSDDETKTAAASAEMSKHWDAMDNSTRVLDEPQFTRRDVLDVTGLSDAQLKNTLDRDLVQLRSEHNPGSGRRRMFTGGDILKLATAHTMSAIGFPLKFSYLIADEIERRAANRLIGSALGDDFGLITYPMENGDWVRIPITADVTDKPELPIAYQVVEIDRLIDETLAKLNALISEQPIPDFAVPEPTLEPSMWTPENDFFRKWMKDEEGRDVFIGLTFDETHEFTEHREAWFKGERERDLDKIQYFVELEQRHERARMARINEERTTYLDELVTRQEEEGKGDK